MEFTHQCLQGKPAKRPFVAPEGAVWSRQLAWSDVIESDSKKRNVSVWMLWKPEWTFNWPCLAHVSLKTVKTISETSLTVGVNIRPTWCQQHVCKFCKLVGSKEQKQLPTLRVIRGLSFSSISIIYLAASLIELHCGSCRLQMEKNTLSKNAKNWSWFLTAWDNNNNLIWVWCWALLQ